VTAAVVTSPPSTSLVVPSFRRPALLRGCLAAVAAQTVVPTEVLVVARRDDEETAAVASAAAGLDVRLLRVSLPGHIPPLVAGVEAARGEVVLFVDDDCEPWPEWVATIVRHYDDPRVGGVGGRVLQPGFEDEAPAARIGRIPLSGRFDRLSLHRPPVGAEVRDVDVLRGTNMSFRRALLAGYAWDARLNRGAASDYEVALCAWVRRRGYRLVYDARAVVRHHLGPRPEIGRALDARAIRDYSHNLVYVSATALPRWQRPIAVAGAFLVGNRSSYGLATALGDLAGGRRPSWRGQVLPALWGKVEGLRSALAYARSGPAPWRGGPASGARPGGREPVE